jgi:hypothetical protein
LADKIRRLRDDRIAGIVAGETPVSLEARPKVVVQVVPISSFSIGSQVSVSELYKERSQLRPIYYEQQSHRINFDGVVNFCYDSNPALCNSYVQGFRAGTIEAVDTNLFVEENGKKTIPSTTFERDLIAAVDKYLKFQEALGIVPPIFVMITLLDVRGYSLGIKRDSRASTINPIDRDVLLLPEMIVEEYKNNTAGLLRPAFDAVWQASGFLRSGNYDENGKWIAK